MSTFCDTDFFSSNDGKAKYFYTSINHFIFFFVKLYYGFYSFVYRGDDTIYQFVQLFINYNVTPYIF